MTKEWVSEISGWETEYLNMNKMRLSEREKEILKGDAIKSHEGMLLGSMYADWKKQKGYD